MDDSPIWFVRKKAMHARDPSGSFTEGSEPAIAVWARFDLVDVIDRWKIVLGIASEFAHKRSPIVRFLALEVIEGH